MNKIAIYLNRQLRGNVFDKESILEAYSTDRSVLKLMPKLVAIPENTSDVKKICKFINQLAKKDYKLPIAVRGSGLDTTGADLTNGIVISTEHLNKIKEIDSHDRLVHVQAGVTLGSLNSALASHGLIVPVNADPRETIGALVSNCPTDSYAGKYGGVTNFVDRMEVVLSNGETLRTTRLNPRTLAKAKSSATSEGDIYRNMDRLISDNSETIEGIKGTRNSAGYPYIQYIVRNEGKTFDLLPVYYGAQGTLGIITEVILRAEVIPPKPEHIIVSFSSFRSAHEFLEYARKLRPLELQFFDMRILKSAESAGNRPIVLTKSVNEGYLVYISFADKARIMKRKIEKCLEYLPKSAKIIRETKENTGDFATLFNALASYLNDDLRGERAPFVSDFYIPGDEISGFVNDISVIEEKYKVAVPIYGSYATSIYSVRPDIQMNTETGRKFLVEFMNDFNKLIKYHFGYLCGGTPEGRLKALLTNHEFTPEEKKLYKDLKLIMDPERILAPDIKLGADPRTTSHHFRTEENTLITT